MTAGAQGDLALAARQIGYDQRAFWRNRRGAFFSFVFPLMLLILFGIIDSGQKMANGRPFVAYFVPGILAYGIVTTTFSNLAVSLAVARDNGVIKRLQGTPLPWWVFVVGRLGSAVVVAITMTVLVLAIGFVGFGVAVRPATLPGVALALILGTACFAMLGIGIVRLIPTADTAAPMTAAIALPLAFISGTFFPMTGGPKWLHVTAAILPLQPLADALQTAFDPQTPGPGIVWHDMRTLAIWIVVGFFVMTRILKTLSRRD
jgi:ABC-2 type transport system permease protein